MKPGSTVLVTGGCGYIGSHVVRRLSAAGISVVVLDDLSTGVPEALLHGEKLVRGSCGDAKLLERVFAEHQFSAVLHFAARISVPESVAEPAMYYLNNTAATITLVTAAARAGVGSFIFSSTAAVYGAPSTASPISEDAAPAPVNPYGASKAMSERIISDIASAAKMRAVILRYFNVAGAAPDAPLGQHGNAHHLIKAALDAALGRTAGLTIFGTDYQTPDGTCIRDFLHVEDLAEAHLLALRHAAAGGGNLTLNCGYGHGASVREVVEVVQRITGIRFPVAIGPRRTGDVPSLIASSDRIRRLLGWTPRYDDLSLIVRDAWNWEAR
jgi:UDP-glucose 4-epimerase